MKKINKYYLAIILCLISMFRFTQLNCSILHQYNFEKKYCSYFDNSFHLDLFNEILKKKEIYSFQYLEDTLKSIYLITNGYIPCINYESPFNTKIISISKKDNLAFKETTLQIIKLKRNNKKKIIEIEIAAYPSTSQMSKLSYYKYKYNNSKCIWELIDSSLKMF